MARSHTVMACFTLLMVSHAGQGVSAKTDETTDVVKGSQVLHAEVVWVESAPENFEVMFSALKGKTWSQPVVLATSNQAITTPAISTDRNGNKLLLWSQVRRSKVILMQSQKLSGSSAWSTPAVFSAFGQENLGPTMVVDDNNQRWFFWSANHGNDMDDIYYTTDGAQPQRAHLGNEVPDFKPVANLSLDGEIVLNWQTYSPVTYQYVDSNRTFKIDKTSESRYKRPLSDENEARLEDIVYPDFVTDKAASVLHFPHNVFVQSLRLD